LAITTKRAVMTQLRNRRWTAMAILTMAVCTSVATPPCAALTILGYEDRLHDRFYVGPDRAFIGDNQPWSLPGDDSDWSGVGRWIAQPHPVNNFTRSVWTVTMISENWFITANHVRPSTFGHDPGQEPPVRFYRTDDPNGEYWESPVALLPTSYNYTGIQVGSADIWVGQLAQTPPDWVRRYPLVKRNTATNWHTFIDPTVYLFGQDDPPPFDYTTFRVGRNEVEHRMTGATTYDLESEGGLGADEARLEGTDSSSPSFAITPAGPSLFNVNVNYSGGPTMPQYVDQILALVPEPVPVVTDLLGDLDADYDVDASDSAILTMHMSMTGATYLDGDLNRDGAVDSADDTIMNQILTGPESGKLLRAPADFDKNNVIDGLDFAYIANHWLQAGGPTQIGDASGDGMVDRDDILVFESNRISPLSGVPLVQMDGDANSDGIVNNADMELWTANKGRQDVPPPYFIEGDVTGDPFVNHADLAFMRDHYGDLYADVNGDAKVNLADIDVIIDPAHWLQPAPNGLADGDLNFDNIVNELDLAAAGSFLGASFRAPLPFRNIGVIEGDYDGDFDVDGADFLLWQQALGSMSWLVADGDNSGAVDAGDLAMWQANFEDGELPPPTPPPPPAAAVPEPASLALICLAAGLVCMRRAVQLRQ